MLSKKIVVSFMSLPLIVALAFLSPAATAAEFNVELHTPNDIGAAPGLQLPYPADNTLEVLLYFEQAVVLETAHLQISGYDANDVYDPAIRLAATYPVWPITAARGFRVSITVTPGTSKVRLRVLGGIPSHDPSNDDASQEFTAEIGVLNAGPKVYSISRGDHSTAPLTGGTVNVVIELSQQPLAFEAAHINVTNATASTPVKLTPYRVPTYLRSQPFPPRPVIRTVRQLRSDIKYYMNNWEDASFLDRFVFDIEFLLDLPPPPELIETVRALRRAVNNIGTPWPWRYWYIDAAGALMDTALWNGMGTDYELFPLVNGAVPIPTTQGTVDLTDKPPPANLTIPKESFDRSAEEPPIPNPADYATQAAYEVAGLRYNALSGSGADDQRAAYQNELIAYERYMELQQALQAHDIREQQAWDQHFGVIIARERAQEQVIRQHLGPDDMLHPYSVTITPTYADSSPVVVKVNRWANTDVPPAYYTPPALETDYIERFDKRTIAVSETAVKDDEDDDEIVIPEDFLFGFSPFFSALEREQIQEQIDLLIATGDRSPAAMQTLIYLQQLLASARPEKTQLLANYPNPFNPETWIPYELATDTDVKITIYNAQGVVIRTLQLGQQSAGYYTDRERAAYWDGRNALGEQVASGIYFYQFETDTMSSLRKMVILK